jgi:sugar O-acyltransferase (sialic acid O-acetyltransferase NeuD family)
MLLAGAKGHAKEVLQVLINNGFAEKILFFDDFAIETEDKLFNSFPIIKSLSDAKLYFNSSPNFILALGNSMNRKTLAEKLISIGGSLTSIISNTASVGSFGVELANGLNIMHGTMISNNVRIGEGSLINAFASVHHDSEIGDYCEISPGAILLGECVIGNYTAVGANATILPKIKIGKNVIIGAGALVNKDLPDNCVAFGVPIKIYKLND